MDATDRQRGAEAGEGRGGGGGGREGEGEGEGEETDIKSNNPHLTGGEIQKMFRMETGGWKTTSLQQTPIFQPSSILFRQFSFIDPRQDRIANIEKVTWLFHKRFLKRCKDPTKTHKHVNLLEKAALVLVAKPGKIRCSYSS